MDPITAALIGMLILLVIGGVWGYTIIAGFMQRRLREAEHAGDAARLEDLRADHAQLEARLEQLEEELDFLRALHGQEPLPGLPAPDDSAR